MLQEEHSATLSTFIELPFVIKIFVLFIFKWPFYDDFTMFRLVSTSIQTHLHAVDRSNMFLEKDYPLKAKNTPKN